MPLQNKKSFIAKIFDSPYTAVVLLVFALLLAPAVYERYVTEREAYDRRVEVAEEKDVLKQRKQELQEEVDYLSTERGMEAEMRSNFDVAKPGEEVIILTGKSKVSENTIDQEETDTKPSFWRSLLPW